MIKFKVKLFNLAFMVALAVFLGAGASFAAPSDIQGHWAEKQISAWVDKGTASGYPDGSFKPDDSITRAEFITLVNRSFGFTGSAQITFMDVSTTDWFFEQVCRARAANYISGYEDDTLRPNNEISRQEVAVILSRLLKLNVKENMAAISTFKDADSISQWSKRLVNAVVAGGYMSGYPDQTYQPDRAITRAEAIVTLDRAMVGTAKTTTFNKAEIFGPESGVSTIDGDVVVSSAGVTLQNTAINGSLLLAEGIGDGDVYLKNVTVKGTTTIKGGGAHSINLENCTLGTVIVNKEDGTIRIVASGGTTVLEVRLESGAQLEEVNLTGDGFGNITVSGLPANSVIRLSGNFNGVRVSSPNVTIELVSGSVERLDVTETSTGTVVKVTDGNVRELNISAKAVVNVENGNVTKLTVSEKAAETMINLAAQANVTTLTLDAAAKVTGQGSIETALVKANGAIIEQTPKNTILANGITTTIASKVVTQSTTVTPGGGGSGGGSSSGDTGAPKITAATITVEGNVKEVTISDDGLNGNINLNGFSQALSINGGTISVSEASNLTLSVQVRGYTIPVSQELEAGLNNLDVINYLSQFGKNGITLGEFKDLFGSPIILSGTLTDSSNNSSAVRLTITMP